MDMRDQLKSMLNNMINDNPDQASMDLHGYLTMKMRAVSGLATTPEVVEPEVVQNDDDFNPSNPDEGV